MSEEGKEKREERLHCLAYYSAYLAEQEAGIVIVITRLHRSTRHSPSHRPHHTITNLHLKMVEKWTALKKLETGVPSGPR